MDFDTIINRKDTGSIKYDLNYIRGYSEDTIPVWIADMDFKSPECVNNALIKLAGHGVYGYSFITEKYKEAVAGWFERRHGWRPEKEWLIQTPGVVYALAAAVRSLTKPDDAVMVLSPVYSHFFPPVNDNGRKLVWSELVYDRGRYSIDFENVEEVMDREKPAMLIFCSPHNPIGRVWTEDELRRLAKLCLDRGILVVADEIHCDFVYPGRVHTPFLSLSEEIRQISISCTAPSKTFNLAGLEASNIIIPNPELRKAFKKEMNAQSVHGISLTAAAACQAAYEGGDEWLEQLLVYLKGTYDAADEFLKDNIPELKLLPLEGTYLAWIDAKELGMEKDELESFMKEKARVRFSYGEEYGAGGEGFLRLNIAAPRHVIIEALERVKTAISDRKP